MWVAAVNGNLFELHAALGPAALTVRVPAQGTEAAGAPAGPADDGAGAMALGSPTGAVVAAGAGAGGTPNGVGSAPSTPHSARSGAWQVQVAS